MKCLLCNFEANNDFDVENHYVNYHKINKENVFFRRLIDKKDNVFHGEKCIICNEFIPSSKFKRSHDFLKHYKNGKDFTEYSDQEQPLSIVDIGSIRKYEINFKEHSSYYDFFNAQDVVDSFLSTVKRKIKRSEESFLIRCGFSIENIQPTLDNYNEPLKNTRYWTTDPIETKSFNDFVYFNVRESILKRVINSGLTGSSWHFNRFVYINIKTFRVDESVLKS